MDEIPKPLTRIQRENRARIREAALEAFTLHDLCGGLRGVTLVFSVVGAVGLR